VAHGDEHQRARGAVLGGHARHLRAADGIELDLQRLGEGQAAGAACQK
jgi:hypothetical protein